MSLMHVTIKCNSNTECDVHNLTGNNLAYYILPFNCLLATSFDKSWGNDLQLLGQRGSWEWHYNHLRGDPLSSTTSTAKSKNSWRCGWSQTPFEDYKISQQNSRTNNTGRVKFCLSGINLSPVWDLPLSEIDTQSLNLNRAETVDSERKLEINSYPVYLYPASF